MYKEKPSICFVSLNSYPIVSGKNIDNIGGAELQQILLAKDLHKHGFQVSYVVFDHGQESREVVDGIEIYSVGFPKGYMLSGLKSYLSVLRLYWKALSKTNADIYYQRCAARDTGVIALFCLVKRKKFVFSLASDKDVDGTFIKHSTFFEQKSYKFGIKRANCIIAQSEYQQDMVREVYNRDSFLIKNAHPMDHFHPREDKLPIVLWVGTIKPEWKQPELFLKLAEELPEINFQMVGGASTNKEYFYHIKKRALGIPNLDFCGFIPYTSINSIFASASVFLNTSSVEGFPNTFIQAWGSRTPVISLNVDPDEIICKYKLGFHSRTFDQMIKDVKALMDDPQMRDEMGKNGRDYVEREHDLDKISQKYIDLFKNI